MAGARCQPSAAPPAPSPARPGPATWHLPAPCRGASGCCAHTPVQNPAAAPERSKVLASHLDAEMPRGARQPSALGMAVTGEMRQGLRGLFWGGGGRWGIATSSLFGLALLLWVSDGDLLPAGSCEGLAPQGTGWKLSSSPYKQGCFIICWGCPIFRPKYIPEKPRQGQGAAIAIAAHQCCAPPRVSPHSIQLLLLL